MQVFPKELLSELSSSLRYPGAKFEVAKKVAAPQQTHRRFTFNYRQLVHIFTAQGTQRLVSAITASNHSQLVKRSHGLAHRGPSPFVSWHPPNIMQTYEPS